MQQSGRLVIHIDNKLITYHYTFGTGNFFTKYDQELAATFSAYCGISLYHVSIKKQ